VRIRWLPNHPEIIEIFDATTGVHLGSAHPSDEASPEQRKRLISARARRSRELQAAVRAAEARRRIRYAAATTATGPEALGSVSEHEAAIELAQERDSPAAPVSRPGLLEHRPPAARWALPRTTPTRQPTTPGRDEDAQ
jgi:putative transposase